MDARVEDLKRRLMDLHQQHGYKLFDPYPIITDDSTVFFTNAAVTPFKRCYGPSAEPHSNYAIIQPCFRYGGTTEIESIGSDPESLTWFEMFGSGTFSTNYREAVGYLLDLLREFGLGLDQFCFTVPNQTFTDALSQLGVASGRIFPLERNGIFWRDWVFGKPGPVGSGLTLIVIREGHTPPVSLAQLEANEEARVELLNLIVIDRYDPGDGNMIPSKYPGFDLGMGVERFASVLQRCSCYEIDSIAPLLSAVHQAFREAGIPLTVQTARIITDHLRSMVLLLTAGITPSNKGHQYVVRRCLRRLIETVWIAGGSVSMLQTLAGRFAARLAGRTDDTASLQKVTTTITDEAAALAHILETGERLLECKPQLTDAILHDTYGLSPGLLRLLRTRRKQP